MSADVQYIESGIEEYVAKYAFLLDMQHNAIVIVNEQSIVVYANPAFYQLTGVNRQSGHTQSLKEMIPRFRKVDALIQNSLSENKVIEHKDTLNHHVHKQILPLVFTINPLVNQADFSARGALLTIAEDSHQLIKFFNTETEKLTQRIHALSYELRSKLKLINALFDNSPVGMMVLDEKSTIMQINKAGMKILGATSSLIGISCNHFYDAGASEFNQTGKSVIEPLETSAVTESGDEITILRCSVRAKDEEKLVYETFVDITEIEKARINSERAKQAAEKANQAKTDFLANVTHELQTPLNIIMGYSQLGMMLDEDVPLDEIKKSFHKIMVSSEDLKSFIGSLLDISKANAGKLSFNKQKEFLRCVIKQAVDECSVLCNDKGIVVNQDLSDMIGLYNLDAGRFKQVIRNLLTNAIHFSPDNSEIRITGRVIDDFIDIRVMDSGPGIPDEELGKIFGKFEQSSIKVDGAGGTGLGLFICHEIIAAHNGSIYAENRQQGGAKFIIRLPLLASN